MDLKQRLHHGRIIPATSDLVAVSCGNTVLQVIDMKDTSKQFLSVGHNKELSTRNHANEQTMQFLSCTPDGSTIISSSPDESGSILSVWERDAANCYNRREDVANGSIIEGIFRCCAISPDASTALCAYDDQILAINLKSMTIVEDTQKFIREYERSHAWAASKWSYCEFSTCGSASVLADSFGRVWIGGGQKEPLARPFAVRKMGSTAAHLAEVTSCSFGPNWQLVTGGLDNVARVWSLNIDSIKQLSSRSEKAFVDDDESITRGCELKLLLAGHRAAVNDVCWSSDGFSIVSASDDKTVRLWDSASGEPLTVLTYSRPMRLCSISTDSSRLLVGSKDGQINLMAMSDVREARLDHSRVAMKSSGSKWSQESAIMIAIAGGSGGDLDASAEEDGHFAKDGDTKTLDCGGKAGHGGGGYPFQGGFGGSGWKSGAKNLSPDRGHQIGATLAPALSDPDGLFLGGFHKNYDGYPSRFGGLGGGGTAWYGSGGGGGYSGGGGSTTNGKGGGGGSFISSGIEGLRKTREGTVTNVGPGKVRIKTPSGKEIYIGSDMNGKEKFGFELLEPIQDSDLFFETSGVVVFEAKETGVHQISVHGAGSAHGEQHHGRGADLYFEILLKEGFSVGVLAGNRSNSRGLGSGASIVWLGAGLQETFVNSLTASRASSALRMLDSGAVVNDEVCRALLNQNEDGDTKWALLLADSSPDSKLLVQELLAKRADQLKATMNTSRTLLTALVVGKEEGVMRILDKGAMFDDDTYDAFISQPFDVLHESRLYHLVNSRRSWDVIRRLTTLRDGLVDVAMYEAIRCKMYDLCELLLRDDVKLSDSLVDLLLQGKKKMPNEKSVWASFIKDVNGVNDLGQSLVALSVDRLGTDAVINLMELDLFDDALSLVKKWSIEVKSFRSRLVEVNSEKSSLLHEKALLVDSADFIHHLVLADQSLVDERDGDDRRVYDVAAKPVRLKMDDATLFCGRFKVVSKTPEHKSATSLVLRAVDVLEEDMPVVLKLMSKKDQYHREVEQRNLLDGLTIDEFFIPILMHSDSPELKPRWENEVGEKLQCAHYLYGVVMPAGDRNLQSIYMQERPSLNSLRSMFEQILHSVDNLHQCGIMHGDIKPLNFVRLSTDHKLRLIDFDAAVSCDDPDSTNHFAGCKFSSGYLPPELFAQLNREQVEQFHEYWRAVGAVDSEEPGEESILDKVKPLKFGSKSYVVKTFHVDRTGAPLNTAILPYDLVEASRAVDIWALGVLFYQLLVGESFARVSRDDDLISGKNADALYSWSSKTAQVKLKAIKDNVARDLVERMLQRFPDDRPCVEELLQHPFFTMSKISSEDPGMQKELAKLTALVKSIETKQDEICSMMQKLDERTRNIEGITLRTRSELSISVNELKKRISSASDVTIPTIFVICPVADQDGLMEEMKELKSGLKEKDLTKATEKSLSLFNKVKSLYSAVSGAVTNPIQSMTDKFKELLGDSDFEMFLLCQICYEKQSSGDPDGSWPVKITRSSEKRMQMASKILPLAKASLEVASVINAASGIGRLLGYPIPRIPVDVVDLSTLEAKSSIGDYEELEERLFKSEKQQDSKEPLKGYLMREYQRFLEEHDKNQDWGRLQRIILDDGLATWCCEKCARVVEEHPDASLDELRSISIGDDEEWALVETTEETMKEDLQKVEITEEVVVVATVDSAKKQTLVKSSSSSTSINKKGSWKKATVFPKDNDDDDEQQQQQQESSTSDMLHSIQSTLARIESKIDAKPAPKKSLFGF